MAGFSVSTCTCSTAYQHLANTAHISCSLISIAYSHRLAETMSKLSEPLKAFINAAHARPNTTPAPRHIASVYEKIARDAGSKKVGMPAWLTVSVRCILKLLSPHCICTNTPADRRDHDDELTTIPAGAVRLGDVSKLQQRTRQQSLDGGVDARSWAEVYRSERCTQSRLNHDPSGLGLTPHATGPPNNQLSRSLLQRSPPGRPNRTPKTQTPKVPSHPIAITRSPSKPN